MNSLEKSESKDPINLAIIALAVGQAAILGAAVFFISDNPKELNSSPIQTVDYQSHSVSTIAGKP